MANNAPVKYGTAPVGRLIMGDPWNKQTKDQHDRPIPEDKQKFFFGVAIEKSAPGVNEMLGTLNAAATEAYMNVPNVMQQIQMGLGATAFSWKVQDGDEMIVDPATGQQRLRNQHAAGCWIFKFSTTIPIRPAKYPAGSNVPVDCDPSEIRKGFYVQVSYSTQANGNMDHTAGVYLNPKTVALVGYGEEIVTGPSLEQQFSGGTGGYVPAGMTTTPQAPMGAPGAVSANPGMPAVGAQVPPSVPVAGAGMGQNGMASAPAAVGQPPMTPGLPQPGGNPMGNPAAAPAGMPQNPAVTGMPQMPAGAGMPNAGAPASQAPATAYPSNGMPPAPGNATMPAPGGMPTPADNGQNGATSSPGNPPAYGGYMTPPA